MLNLSFNQKLTTITHESEKESRGTSYFYGATNTFQARLLAREGRASSIYHLFHVTFDQSESWTSVRAGPLPLYHVSQETAESLFENSKTNFQKITRSFQRACEQNRLIPIQSVKETTGYRNYTETQLCTLIRGDIDQTLTRMCENTKGELQDWFNSVKASLRLADLKVERIHNGQHIQDFCNRCLFLGRQCTIRMEPSNSPNHPNDVVMKGLPANISDEQLRQIANVYGTVVKSHLMPENPMFYDRMAFVTFRDRLSALQKFNQDA